MSTETKKPANPNTPIIQYRLKGRNRRIIVDCFHTPTGPSIVINTRTLQGDWKGRKITAVTMIYGNETMNGLLAALNDLMQQPLYQRSLQPYLKAEGEYKAGVWLVSKLPQL